MTDQQTHQPRVDYAVELAGMFNPAETRDMIQMVDQLGYDMLWWCDYRFYRDVYSLLTQTAIYSDRLKYGTFVTDPFARHPALTALAMGTADELGGGRGVLGFGAGVSGLKEMGIERLRPAKSIREAVELMRELWANSEADYHGETTQFTGTFDQQFRSDLPVYIASNSPLTLGVAGELGDGIIVEGLRHQNMLDYAQEHAQKGLDRSGRKWSDLYSVARLDVCISDDRNAAIDTLRGRVQHYVSVHGSQRWEELAALVPPSLEQEIRDAGFTHEPETVKRLASKIPPEATKLLTLGGTDDDVAEQLEDVKKLGVNQVSIFPIPNPEEGITIPDIVERFGRIMAASQ